MTRHAYEWETETSKTAIQSNIAQLRSEIKRISNTTLRGNFTSEDDRQYWVKRLSTLNSKLNALEQQN